MKLTTEQLKKIIKEELEAIMTEDLEVVADMLGDKAEQAKQGWKSNKQAAIAGQNFLKAKGMDKALMQYNGMLMAGNQSLISVLSNMLKHVAPEGEEFVNHVARSI